MSKIAKQMHIKLIFMTEIKNIVCKFINSACNTLTGNNIREASPRKKKLYYPNYLMLSPGRSSDLNYQEDSYISFFFLLHIVVDFCQIYRHKKLLTLRNFHLEFKVVSVPTITSPSPSWTPTSKDKTCFWMRHWMRLPSQPILRI